MDDKEKIQLAIDRMDNAAETWVDLIANGSRLLGMSGGWGPGTLMVCRTHAVCYLASWLKDTSRLLATIGEGPDMTIKDCAFGNIPESGITIKSVEEDDAQKE